MRDFAALYAAIDETNKTNEKVAAMARYFASAPPEDAAWAVHFLIGRRPKRLINTTKMWEWAVEEAGIPGWLFGECYDAVGDLAETIALVLPEETEPPPPTPSAAQSSAQGEGASLKHWVENRLLPIGGAIEEEQRAMLLAAWRELGTRERFVFNKLITGAFRVGVSSDLVIRALSQASGVPAATIAHRLMGWWDPTADFFARVVSADEADTDLSRPYPFCLAHPLPTPDAGSEPTKALEDLGRIEDWHAEWKWDGIRAQVIRRQGQSFIWSRGEDLVTERFPEVKAICDRLPYGTALDGEILGWREGKPIKFLELQRRIGRKVLGKKILEEVPVVLVAFDILEHEGEDVRERPLAERRELLEAVVDAHNAALARQGTLELAPAASTADVRLAVEESEDEAEPPPPKPSPSAAQASAQGEGALQSIHSPLLLSRTVQAESWAELAALRETARDLNVEGLMLKRLDSPYVVGRKKGLWWKWKIDPFSVDCVLIYAQRGNGKRASLYTDYTFGVWSGGSLVPFAKAYTGLTDQEIRQVDSWVRRNTLERFGPVRAVKPELVFELAFEAIQLSSRHKSGVAVRFPRIARWRHDKTPEQADTLEGVKEILKTH